MFKQCNNVQYLNKNSAWIVYKFKRLKKNSKEVEKEKRRKCFTYL